GYESGGRFIMSEKQNDPAYASRYEIAGSWTPRRMKSFSVELLTGALRRFDPYYIYAPAATVDGVEVVYPGYTETYNRLKMSYKVTKQLSLSNETYQSFDGFYEGSRNGSDRGRGDYRHRFQNIIKASYSL